MKKEKSIINYKDKQIEFLKNLINYFDMKDPFSFSFDKINLEDFYQELSNTKTLIRNYQVKNEKEYNNKSNNNRSLIRATE